MSKILVFDLDDTLFLERTYVLSGFRAVSCWLEKQLDVHGFYNVCLEAYQSGMKKKTFNHALERLAVAYDENLIKKMVQVYRSHSPKIELLDDAKQTLHYFFNKRPLALITDGYYVAQKNKITALDINKFFDFIVYSDANGKESWKPSDWPYLQVEKYYKNSSADYVYIADNVVKDFITPKKLGWQTIHVRRSEGEYYCVSAAKEYQADQIIDSLLDLKKIII